MKLADFDYDLPLDRIAQGPLKHRDASRLMIINRSTGELNHTQFSQIAEFLPDKSLLVLNDTKVIPARVIGNKSETGGKIELLLIQEKETDTWEVLAKPRRMLKVGTQLIFGNDVLKAEVLEKPDNGNCIVHFIYAGVFFEILAEIGMMPLPPYIRRSPNEEDEVRYQSVYASTEGCNCCTDSGIAFYPRFVGKITE